MTATIAGGVLRRLTAFSDDPRGGNPAGVWIGDELPAPAEMRRIAADVGYSETAFLARRSDGAYETRYYSPEAEVPFCGHATIAAGVVLGGTEGPGTYLLATSAGDVPVEARAREERWTATLTSVAPRHVRPSPVLLDGALAALGWSRADLDPSLPPALAFAGAWHLVLAAADRARLDRLEYDFDRLKSLMLDADLTTLQLVWRESRGVFHARDPFPVGGVVEDPATGAAAAALGGYLRDAGLLPAPFELVIHQGTAMGRPSRIEVRVPERGGVAVSGTATPLEATDAATTTATATAAAGAEALARDFLRRVWSSNADLDAIDSLMTDDYVLHSAGTVVRGRDAFKEWVRTFRTALRDAENEVLDVFADGTGERVAARWICRGSNRGIFGLPPDGAPVEFSGIAVWRVRDGRLAECWVERSALEAVRARENSTSPDRP